MSQDGLVSIEGNDIRVLPAGRLLIRNICMVFDRYLGAEGQTARFSKVI
jgi:oxygen-independent coproporphyrinogen-3 oxidase